MLITQEDKMLTAYEAKFISMNNRDDSEDRTDLRNLMQCIHYYASVGHTEYMEMPFSGRKKPYNDAVVGKLKELGYGVERIVTPNGYYGKWDGHTIKITW
jgi:hypothetical protein